MITPPFTHRRDYFEWSPKLFIEELPMDDLICIDLLGRDLFHALVDQGALDWKNSCRVRILGVNPTDCEIRLMWEPIK